MLLFLTRWFALFEFYGPGGLERGCCFIESEHQDLLASAIWDKCKLMGTQIQTLYRALSLHGTHLCGPGIKILGLVVLLSFYPNYKVKILEYNAHEMFPHK